MSIYLPKASTGSLRNASRSLVAGSSRQYRGYATGVKTQEVPEVGVEFAFLCLQSFSS
jgi:hypothetical protein